MVRANYLEELGTNLDRPEPSIQPCAYKGNDRGIPNKVSRGMGKRPEDASF